LKIFSHEWGRRSLKRQAPSSQERFSTSPQGPAPESACVPPGSRVYAFGDVHGRADLLQQLRCEIKRSLDDRAPQKAVVVGLGDYIDRGPDSRGVIELLQEGFDSRIEHVFLRGNHEELFLGFLNEPEASGKLWFRMGGLDCLRSYGVDIGPYTGASPDMSKAREDFVRCLPSGHVAFIQTLPMWSALGDYLFVHAGVRTHLPLSEQATEDLLWIREGFSDRDEPFEKIVVHGHSPTDVPYVGRHRICIDTAAYATNRLTCIVLEGTQREILQVGLQQ
jgi:serine/threonine protein phosphatase 1